MVDQSLEPTGTATSFVGGTKHLRAESAAPRGASSSVMRILIRSLAIVEGLVGLALLAGGAWLVALGGSLYYALVGASYVGAAILFWKLREAGAWLTVGVLLVTVIWAVWESGLNYWALFPRLLIPTGMAVVALLLAASLVPTTRRPLRLGSYLGASTLLVLMVSGFSLAFTAHGVVGPPAGAPFNLAPADNLSSDWTHYGRTPAGTRFAPFSQITRENVGKLQLAWTVRSGDRVKGSSSDQNTPLAIGDTLYTCTPQDLIAALDVDTGVRRWSFSSGSTSPMRQRCRSLGYFDSGASDGRLCTKRIFNSTIDARLIALDAATGKPCPGFGEMGIVDLTVGMGEVKPGYYFTTSAPLVARDRIIIGGWVVDNEERGEPSGVVRAFDANTGALVWAWDLGNPAITKLPPLGETYTRGTPNMWTTPSFDDTLGLVYVPLGNETPDYYGIGRNPSSELYNATLVALDVETGRERWKFQTVHHDIWDYDLPSQPALVDLPDGKDGITPAVLQATKRGQLFLLNRATGEPLAQVEERPVPQTGQSPGERLSPTQPFSVGMPQIGGDLLTEAKMWGMTMLDQLHCRIEFRRHRYDGDFTPIGLGQFAIAQPGNIGGLNWGSLAIDPTNLYAYMVDIRIPTENRLWPAAEFEKVTSQYPPSSSGHGNSLMQNTPYGIVLMPWLSALGVPCVQPPFGTVTAVDLKTRKIAWQVPAGTSEEVGPLGIKSYLPMKIGMPGYAGPSATAGGLVFFAGFQDFYLRAYDAETGQELWKHALPVGASATPLSYMSPKTGRQYVLLSVGGATGSSKFGDYIMAFALPSPANP